MKISKFEIKVKDYVVQPVKDGKMYITDSVVDKKDFADFLEFYENHIEDGEHFSTSFDNIDFYGRFGQLLFDQKEDVSF